MNRSFVAIALGMLLVAASAAPAQAANRKLLQQTDDLAATLLALFQAALQGDLGGLPSGDAILLILELLVSHSSGGTRSRVVKPAPQGNVPGW